MQLIGVNILKNGVPSSATYTYKAEDDIEVGDTVVMDMRGHKGKAIVAKVNVEEKDIPFPLDGIKAIDGKIVEVEEKESN